jgi:adenylate kinase
LKVDLQVLAAEEAGKKVVLINPILKDVPSHSGIMGVRGREERLRLQQSFETIYHFRLLYYSGSFYPIVGALRYSYGGAWQVFASTWK